jgi:hypothetical protein
VVSVVRFDDLAERAGANLEGPGIQGVKLPGRRLAGTGKVCVVLLLLKRTRLGFLA